MTLTETIGPKDELEAKRNELLAEALGLDIKEVRKITACEEKTKQIGCTNGSEVKDDYPGLCSKYSKVASIRVTDGWMDGLM